MDTIIAQYGSLAQAPDQALEPLWSWLGTEMVGDVDIEASDTPAVRLAKCRLAKLNLKLDTVSDLTTLQWLFEYGYSESTLSEWTGISYGKLRRRRDALGVAPRLEFKYMIAKGKTKYYATNLRTKDGHSANAATLERLGYHVDQLYDTRFGDLPVGAVYMTPKGMFRKGESNRDYESPDFAVSRNR